MKGIRTWLEHENEQRRDREPKDDREGHPRASQVVDATRGREAKTQHNRSEHPCQWSHNDDGPRSFPRERFVREQEPQHEQGKARGAPNHCSAKHAPSEGAQLGTVRFDVRDDADAQSVASVERSDIWRRAPKTTSRMPQTCTGGTPVVHHHMSIRTCSKCEGRRFAVQRQFHLPIKGSMASHKIPAVTIGGSSWKVGHLETWICLGCGLTEFYARDIDSLEERAKRYPDQLKIVDYTAPTTGPHR